MIINNIKLIILDVDGVLTDGKLLIGSDGIEYKTFNVKDGMGISVARYAGIKFAIITGRRSEAVSIRAKELGIDYVFQGISDKKEILIKLMNDLNVSKEEICYMGDDLNDLPIIQEVGLSYAPNDAVEVVKEKVSVVTEANGGHGAVREMIESIIKGQLDYNALINDYIYNKHKILQ
ncbi:KdsC family phosphatase [Metabacillus halosaccharovorans]|uniref:HAD-IIIA family hydrolase n=1 Tax=Metabacillus halosaccharovorans TaxID=930124 RepID=A0ABT3DBR2_9BACI|nr:HAD-IIIA family hydrolase [Metabacillus halosaccharovorans]MCV9884485.1 HAD-IIIA family hydrolase [Metabacillus halosaccharovorans]